jgi:hypothetical protein
MSTAALVSQPSMKCRSSLQTERFGPRHRMIERLIRGAPGYEAVHQSISGQFLHCIALPDSQIGQFLIVARPSCSTRSFIIAQMFSIGQRSPTLVASLLRR